LNNDVIGAQQAFTDLFSNVVGKRDPGDDRDRHHVGPELADNARRVAVAAGVLDSGAPGRRNSARCSSGVWN